MNDFSKYNKKSSKKPVLYLAVLLLILGVGNLTFGALKAQDYEQLLHLYEHSINLPSSEIQSKTHSQISKTTKLETKIAFYNIVKFGGVCFLAISCFLFLYNIVINRKEDETEKSTKELRNNRA